LGLILDREVEALGEEGDDERDPAQSCGRVLRAEGCTASSASPAVQGW